MSNITSGKRPPNYALRNDDPVPSEAEAWARANAEAIAQRRVWIDTNGTPLADIQILQGI